RLVEWAGRLRARGLERDGASRAVQERAFSPDDGAEEGLGGGIVDVVSGGEPGRHSEIAGDAPGAAGGLDRAGGGWGRGGGRGGRGGRAVGNTRAGARA